MQNTWYYNLLPYAVRNGGYSGPAYRMHSDEHREMFAFVFLYAMRDGEQLKVGNIPLHFNIKAFSLDSENHNYQNRMKTIVVLVKKVLKMLNLGFHLPTLVTNTTHRVYQQMAKWPITGSASSWVDTAQDTLFWQVWRAIPIPQMNALLETIGVATTLNVHSPDRNRQLFQVFGGNTYFFDLLIRRLREGSDPNEIENTMFLNVIEYYLDDLDQLSRYPLSRYFLETKDGVKVEDTGISDARQRIIAHVLPILRLEMRDMRLSPTAVDLREYLLTLRRALYRAVPEVYKLFAVAREFTLLTPVADAILMNQAKIKFINGGTRPPLSALPEPPMMYKKKGTSGSTAAGRPRVGGKRPRDQHIPGLVEIPSVDEDGADENEPGGYDQDAPYPPFGDDGDVSEERYRTAVDQMAEAAINDLMNQDPDDENGFYFIGMDYEPNLMPAVPDRAEFVDRQDDVSPRPAAPQEPIRELEAADLLAGSQDEDRALPAARPEDVRELEDYLARMDIRGLDDQEEYRGDAPPVEPAPPEYVRPPPSVPAREEDVPPEPYHVAPVARQDPEERSRDRRRDTRRIQRPKAAPAKGRNSTIEQIEIRDDGPHYVIKSGRSMPLRKRPKPSLFLVDLVKLEEEEEEEEEEMDSDDSRGSEKEEKRQKGSEREQDDADDEPDDDDDDDHQEEEDGDRDEERKLNEEEERAMAKGEIGKDESDEDEGESDEDEDDIPSLPIPVPDPEPEYRRPLRLRRPPVEPSAEERVPSVEDINVGSESESRAGSQGEYREDSQGEEDEVSQSTIDINVGSESQSRAASQGEDREVSQSTMEINLGSESMSSAEDGSESESDLEPVNPAPKRDRSRSPSSREKALDHHHSIGDELDPEKAGSDVDDDDDESIKPRPSKRARSTSKSSEEQKGDDQERDEHEGQERDDEEHDEHEKGEDVIEMDREEGDEAFDADHEQTSFAEINQWYNGTLSFLARKILEDALQPDAEISSREFLLTEFLPSLRR